MKKKVSSDSAVEVMGSIFLGSRVLCKIEINDSGWINRKGSDDNASKQLSHRYINQE